MLLGVLLAVPGGGRAGALRIVNHYSPENIRREKRAETLYIILHTTEGSTKGSLRKLYRNGEAHYLVDTAGKVYRIIQKDRVAMHTGRSMWNGRSNLDDCSLGIEVVGYHNKPLKKAQIVALKELIRQLQAIYSVPDHRVLSHSMVAYGAPNRWHKKSHRGRKRCGMQFAGAELRRSLGLDSCPRVDPDVAAGRLEVGDPYLARVLYGSALVQQAALARFTGEGAQVITKGRSAWDVARDQYASAGTSYLFPGGTVRRGDQIQDWGAIPPGTRVILSDAQRDNPIEGIKELGTDGDTALDIAGDEYASESTIYVFPDGKTRAGKELSDEEFRNLPKKTRLLVGYVPAGKITPTRSAFEICGPDWNLASTFYLLPEGKLVPGHLISEKNIPRDTLVFSRR